MRYRQALKIYRQHVERMEHGEWTNKLDPDPVMNWKTANVMGLSATPGTRLHKACFRAAQHFAKDPKVKEVIKKWTYQKKRRENQFAKLLEGNLSLPDIPNMMEGLFK